MAEPNNTPIPASTPRSGSPSAHYRHAFPNHGFSLSQSHFSPLSPSRFARDGPDRMAAHDMMPPLPSVPAPTSSASSMPAAPAFSSPSSTFSSSSSASVKLKRHRILLVGPAPWTHNSMKNPSLPSPLEQEYELVRADDDAQGVSGLTREDVLRGLRNAVWPDLVAVWDFFPSQAKGGFVWDEDLIEALPQGVRGFWIAGEGDRVDSSALKQCDIEFFEVQDGDGIDEMVRTMEKTMLADNDYGPDDGDHE